MNNASFANTVIFKRWTLMKRVMQIYFIWLIFAREYTDCAMCMQILSRESQ